LSRGSIRGWRSAAVTSSGEHENGHRRPSGTGDWLPFSVR
jgi:hypothetical protein